MRFIFKNSIKIFLILLVLGVVSAKITPEWLVDCNYYGGVLSATPDLSCIVVGSNEGISDCWGIYFYNRNGTLMWYYNFSNFGHIDDLKISSDGKYIITAVKSTYKFGIRREYICVFNNKGDLLKKYRIDVGNAKLSVSSNGKYILVGVGRHACLLDRDKGVLWNYEAEDTVSSVDTAKNGRYFVVGSRDGNIYFFNRSGLLWKYQTDGCIESVSINSNMGFICAGGDDWELYLLNYSGNLIKKKHLKYIPLYVKLTNSGNVIVECGEILLCLNKNLTPLWNYKIDAYEGMDIAITPDGKYIAFYDDDTSCPYISEKVGLYMINGSNGRVLWEYPSKYFSGEVEISSDGRYVVALSYKKLYLFDNQKCIENFSPEMQNNGKEKIVIEYGGIVIAVLLTILIIVVYSMSRT
ncbi:hypothetical protein [Methanocaldococcus sp.]